jgi:hypothetical protein
MHVWSPHVGTLCSHMWAGMGIVWASYGAFIGMVGEWASCTWWQCLLGGCILQSGCATAQPVLPMAKPLAGVVCGGWGWRDAVDLWGSELVKGQSTEDGVRGTCDRSSSKPC